MVIGSRRPRSPTRIGNPGCYYLSFIYYPVACGPKGRGSDKQPPKKRKPKRWQGCLPPEAAPRPPPQPPPQPPLSPPTAAPTAPAIGQPARCPPPAAAPRPSGGISYAAAARALSPQGQGGWTTVQRSTRGRQTQPHQPDPPAQSRALRWTKEGSLSPEMQSATTRAPTKPTLCRSSQGTCTRRGSQPYQDLLSPTQQERNPHRSGNPLRTSGAAPPLKEHDPTGRQNRRRDCDITANETSGRRVEDHGVPVARYTGKDTFGLDRQEMGLRSRRPPGG